jgi:hypothetical protein
VGRVRPDRLQATGGTARLNSRVGDTRAMRNGQNKRMRGRNRKSHNPLTRVYESNGPDVKIRGSAAHIAEKYVQLARDAQSSGDPISAENYHQHAEHYFRLIASAQEQFRQPFLRGEGGMDVRGDMSEEDEEESVGPVATADQPTFGTRDPQPYLPRDAQFYPQRDQPNVAREQPNFPREPQSSGRHNQAQPAPGTRSEDDGHVERLPSFITGGGQPAPPQATPANHQNHGSNGFEGQGDRFPLHRRRRRHRGPRADVAQNGPGASEGDDAPQGPRSGTE